MKLSHRGDTIIEVAIAITIISLLITAAYLSTTAAIKLGQSAKERTQAANLLQQQAEGLRNYRDTHTWDQLKLAMQSVGIFGLNEFYMLVESNNWLVKTCPTANPRCYKKDQFTIYIKPVPIGPDKYEFTLTVEWRGSGGATNTSQVSTYLVNLDGIKSQ